MKQNAYIFLLALIIFSTACNRNNDDDDCCTNSFYLNYKVNETHYNHTSGVQCTYSMDGDLITIEYPDSTDGISILVKQVHRPNVYPVKHFLTYFHQGTPYESSTFNGSNPVDHCNLNYALVNDSVILGRFTALVFDDADSLAFGIKEGEFRLRVAYP